ncbi:MAG: sugar ABC transporter permease [Spirochaetaceae bacterium]|nr:MAG: sugar ABC transporter permease [Spirochaetaceae bacterium]
MAPTDQVGGRLPDAASRAGRISPRTGDVTLAAHVSYTLKRKPHLWTREARLAYLLMLPAVLLLVLLMVYPIVYVFMMSLYRTDRIGRLQEFAGMAAYLEVFTTRVFWETTVRTAVWTVLAVLVKAVFGMVIALALNVEYVGRRVARMLFIIPWASSVPISAMLWKWVYDHEFGLLNHTLKATGLWNNPPVWLGAPISAFIATIWVDIWVGIPFMALIFLAGMQAISRDLYESGDIDGANARQKFLHITIPGIRHLILIATMLSSLWTFNDFNTVFILTKGGPGTSTEILITAVYKHGFEWLRFSRAAVMAVVTFIILTVVSLFYAHVFFRQERDV